MDYIWIILITKEIFLLLFVVYKSCRDTPYKLMFHVRNPGSDWRLVSMRPSYLYFSNKSPSSASSLIDCSVSRVRYCHRSGGFVTIAAEMFPQHLRWMEGRWRFGGFSFSPFHFDPPSPLLSYLSHGLLAQCVSCDLQPFLPQLQNLA
jgi:hypothetical protein